MATLDNVDERSFAYRDLLSIDRWESFVVTASLTIIGAPTYVGRYRVVGKECHFQVTLVSSTSIASTAGTHYITLPITAKGIAGFATMMNKTTNVAVGVCVIDIANSRAYLPTLVASGNTFAICGAFEIG